jgi:hypothetical protein
LTCYNHTNACPLDGDSDGKGGHLVARWAARGNTDKVRSSRGAKNPSLAIVIEPTNWIREGLL